MSVNIDALLRSLAMDLQRGVLSEVTRRNFIQLGTEHNSNVQTIVQIEQNITQVTSDFGYGPAFDISQFPSSSAEVAPMGQSHSHSDFGVGPTL